VVWWFGLAGLGGSGVHGFRVGACGPGGGGLWLGGVGGWGCLGRSVRLLVEGKSGGLTSGAGVFGGGCESVVCWAELLGDGGWGAGT
jgi:hypothetical protein